MIIITNVREREMNKVDMLKEDKKEKIWKTRNRREKMKNEESRGEKKDREKIRQGQRTKRIIGKEVKREERNGGREFFKSLIFWWR